MPLLLSIKPSSGDPIYRQIIDQVERMIASGQLIAGETLPSVRQIATEVEVNPMTVSKAYSLLEGQGLLERVRGVGMKVVASEKSQSLEARLTLIEPALDALAKQIKQLNIPEELAMKILAERMEKNDERD